MTDGELAGAFVFEGSREAFDELVSRHVGMVFRTCRRVVGDYHDAEDATQAVFATLADRAGSLTSYRSLAGWLAVQHSVERVAPRAVRRNNESSIRAPRRQTSPGCQRRRLVRRGRDGAVPRDADASVGLHACHRVAPPAGVDSCTGGGTDRLERGNDRLSAQPQPRDDLRATGASGYRRANGNPGCHPGRGTSHRSARPRSGATGNPFQRLDRGYGRGVDIDRNGGKPRCRRRRCRVVHQVDDGCVRHAFCRCRHYHRGASRTLDVHHRREGPLDRSIVVDHCEEYGRRKGVRR